MVFKKLNKLLVVPALALLSFSLVLSSCYSTPSASGPSPSAPSYGGSTPSNPPASKPPALSSPVVAPPAQPSASPIAPTGDLLGAGGTFPAPLYTKWFDVYNTLKGIKVNYQAVGSGAGINQITAGTVDFSAQRCYYDGRPAVQS